MKQEHAKRRKRARTRCPLFRIFVKKKNKDSNETNIESYIMTQGFIVKCKHHSSVINKIIEQPAAMLTS